MKAEYPHKFVGRLDRWCEVCNRPDRDPLHKVENEMNARITQEERVSNQSQKLYKVGDGYVSEEWAKLFLSNWNRAVELWDAGELFTPQKTIMQKSGQVRDQQEYARICCTWLIPNRFQEPHVEAYNIYFDCTCSDCRHKKESKSK